MTTFTDKQKQSAVKDYIKNKNAKALAKKYKCSTSTIYNWIKNHRENQFIKSGKILLNKYDKNKDGFISVKEFLQNHVKKSKGPKAKKGKINYGYQHLDNIYNYLYIFTTKNDLERYAMLPDYALTIRGGIINSSCCIDIYNRQLFFPDEMIASIKKAKKKNSIRFINFSLIIFYTSDDLSHVNSCVIDLKNKTLERFEPHGLVNKKVHDKIDSIFSKFVLKQFEIPKFKYIKPLDFSPIIGIQTKADSYNGMCVTISTIYFLSRLINPDYTPKNIVSNLIKMKKTDLKTLILRFASRVETTLKKNYKIVNKINDDLYFGSRFLKYNYTEVTITIDKFEKKYL